MGDNKVNDNYISNLSTDELRFSHGDFTPPDSWEWKQLYFSRPNKMENIECPGTEMFDEFMYKYGFKIIKISLYIGLTYAIILMIILTMQEKL